MTKLKAVLKSLFTFKGKSDALFKICLICGALLLILWLFAPVIKLTFFIVKALLNLGLVLLIVAALLYLVKKLREDR